MKKTKKIRFIDLFAGLGGTRIGFESACQDLGLSSECVFTSEIKPYAVSIYAHNFPNESIHGDITKIDENEIPDFDFLLGGFPCQAFSFAGKQRGFNDTRGTLFFDVARIIKEKKPSGFLLENVEGLVKHDLKNPKDKIGKTLTVILETLTEMGYKVSWRVLDSSDFSVPQKRKRIYIVGTKKNSPDLDFFVPKYKRLGEVLDQGLNCRETPFRKKLLELYTAKDLYGKAIKDKRGGSENIHSWDLELKGKVSPIQKELLSALLKQRRKKQWAEAKGIEWMDGMPLTLTEIFSFFNKVTTEELKKILDDLVAKDYLKYEYPKKLIIDTNGTKSRSYDENGTKGYNIVSGKLSFELSKILDPNGVAPTIVATEVDRFGVIDGGGIRNLTERECLRIFGFPDSYEVNIDTSSLYDLIGNTVVPPVIKEVSLRLLKAT